MATETPTRTIVETTSTGWYIDAADPDGKRVRKQPGDRIITRDEYEAAKELTGNVDVATDGNAVENGNDAAKDKQAATQAANAEHRTAAARADLGVLTSGKPVKGKTTTIRCAWVDPEKRTKKQVKLFESSFAGVGPGGAYDAVVKAADGNADAMPDGREVVIHVQDAFQVRFHPENQRKHRNELRRRKTTTRREARNSAK